MDGLNYWWNRFRLLREKLSNYRQKYKLKDVEECVEHMLSRLEKES